LLVQLFFARDAWRYSSLVNQLAIMTPYGYPSMIKIEHGGEEDADSGENS
jgi:hypothetical protein